MHDGQQAGDIAELGAASAVTQGYYCPNCFESFVIPDFFDMP